MMILGIDTATSLCSVAIAGEGIQDERKAGGANKHGELLIPLIKDLLLSHNLKVEDLDGVGIAIGPGSFTGLRIGLSTAKGLAIPFKLPLIPVDSMKLCLNLMENKVSKKVVTIIHSHKNLVYYQEWSRRQQDYHAENPVDILEYEKLEERYAGEAHLVGFLAPFLTGKNLELVQPSALVVCQLAEQQYPQFREFDYTTLEPSYHARFKAERWKQYEESRRLLAELKRFLV